MFSFSYSIGGRGTYWIGSKGRFSKGKQVLIETEQYIYGFNNYNPFKAFCSDLEKCPDWLKEVYVWKKLGNWIFWRGKK